MKVRPTLTNVTSRGGLLSYEFLQGLRKKEAKNEDVEPRSYMDLDGNTPVSVRELEDGILDAWNDLLTKWDAISQRYLSMDMSSARTKWIVPLLEGLGFRLVYNKQDASVGEKLTFHLSHKGWNKPNAPYVNCGLPKQGLEEASTDNAEGRHRSVHDELQAYLNVTKECNWGLVTNGIMLRILRQYYHTTTKGYVEFDIENIFRERSYSEFLLLYRLAHVSRFMTDSEGGCILERFHEQSRLAGVTIGQDLRKNVKKAIEALGNGFLTPELAQKFTSDDKACKEYYAELLRVIYRIIFLLFAEQRGMLPTRDSIYTEEYSINKLREIAETTTGEDDHFDLWEGLKITFTMLKHGCPELKVFAYNGTLFDETEISVVAGLRCKNSVLLSAIAQLTSVEQEHVRNRINYLDLGVEEIGSIYESLLEYTPKASGTIEEVEGEVIQPNTFFLDPRGATRKMTGSYYTDRRLIDELIKSALKPVVESGLSDGSNREGFLLLIKVCDPACGSGAFLIAANNFLARELAKIRTKDVEPSERDLRRARRDVLQHCIYGVDLNPMAVELTKVSLWINASVDDLPLNFLNHHIKIGNSLIGTSPSLISGGIPKGAFTVVTGDEPAVSRKMAKVNEASRGIAGLEEFGDKFAGVFAGKFEDLSKVQELKVEDIEAKSHSYQELVTSKDYLHQKMIADAWTATFYWSYRTGSPSAPTTAIIESMSRGGISALDDKAKEEIQRLSGEFKFFHWYLEFPDVFRDKGAGFDCIIGNPPWDVLKANDKEFFGEFDETFRGLAGVEKEERKRQLLESPSLKAKYQRTMRVMQSALKFYKESRRYKLQRAIDSSGKDITQNYNLYMLFLECNMNLLRPGGALGIITPSGLIGTQTSQEIRRFIFEEMNPSSLYEFSEDCGKECFGVSQSFALISIFNRKQDEKTKYLQQIDSLASFFQINANGGPYKSVDWELTKKISPTLSLVCISSEMELTILKKLYSHPTLSRGWNIVMKRELHMTDDRKYIVEFPTDVPMITGEEVGNFIFRPSYRYWVKPEIFQRINPENRQFRIVVRDVININSGRRLISALIPGSIGLNNTVNYVMNDLSFGDSLLLLAFLNSIVLEYRLRQVSQTNHVNQYMILQLPCPVNLPGDIRAKIVSLTSRIVEPSLGRELLAASAEREGISYPSLNPIELGSSEWYESLASLDALVARSFDLDVKEFEYILDSFEHLRSIETKSLSEYRTKRLCLRYFSDFSW